MKPLTTITTTGLITASLAMNSLPGLACGPFFKTAVFNYEINPGLPLSKFSEGSLGVIRPSFARSYLVVAYRYLSNKPLTKKEILAAQDLWKSRLLFEDYENIADSAQEWKKARAKVVDSKIDIYPYGRTGKYSRYLRLTKDAFSTAIDSLNKMITRYGIKSKEVSRWLVAQDIVFNRSESESKSRIKSKTIKTKEVKEDNELEPLPETASEYEKNERQYQIAAYHFYRKRFDKAIKTFQLISRNNKSRWCKMASYLVARAYIRQAQLEKNVDRNALYDKAKTQLEVVLADNSKSSLHEMSRNLLQFVSVRTEPKKILNILANRIASAKSANSFRNDLTDLTRLFDDIEVKQSAGEKDKEKRISPEFQSDLASWIWKFKSSKKEDLPQVLSKWRKSNSLPWLISSMAIASKAIENINSKDLEDLLQAANTVNTNNPGFYSVSYYKSKLLIAKGSSDKASKTIDSVLAKSSKLTPSTVNLFKDLKLQLVNSIDELVALIPRTVAGDDFSDYDMPGWFFSYQNNKEKRPNLVRIAPLTAQLLNTGLPVEALVKISEDSKLPLAIQKNLVPALWLRAVILNKDKQAVKVSYKLEKLIPELKTEMAAFRSVKNAKQRKFLGLCTALRNPGLRPFVTSGYLREAKLNKIDSYRDNWWSKGQTEYYYDSRGKVDSKIVDKIAKRILDNSQLESAKSEYNSLVKLGIAPNYLANEVISYSKIFPSDSRIPEALHRAVRATRYGSTDDQTTVLSKACFKLLYKRYPKSAWTKKTPYHY